jgi:hypothetical protein
MNPNPKLSAVLTLALGAGLAAACSSTNVSAGQDETDGGSAESSGGDSGGGDSGGALQWYTTCGYPLCMVPDGGLVDAGIGCPAIGSACTTQGQTCGTASEANCGVTLLCDNRDPKTEPGGCPISTRKYKDNISYLDDAVLQELHDETLGVKLATYKYKPEVGDPDPTHLGFIIEDNPRSAAVDGARHRVDLYGYMSMVVATTQVQEKEITELRQELEATRREAASCRSRGSK